MNSTVDIRTKVTIGVFIFTGIMILLEHFDGGVVSHHLLAREDLPKISNLWGLLTVPMLSWIVYTIILKRKNSEQQTNQTIKKNMLLAFIFGVSVSVLWELGLQSVLPYFMLLPFLIAFFRPVHLPEFLLGFVIGMIYTFGGVLPIIIGSVLMIICFVINKIITLFKSMLRSNANTVN